MGCEELPALSQPVMHGLLRRRRHVRDDRIARVTPIGRLVVRGALAPEKDDIVGIEAARAAPQRAARRGAISGDASREPRTVGRHATARAREAPGGGEPLVHVDPATRMGSCVSEGSTPTRVRKQPRSSAPPVRIAICGMSPSFCDRGRRSWAGPESGAWSWRSRRPPAPWSCAATCRSERPAAGSPR